MRKPVDVRVVRVQRRVVANYQLWVFLMVGVIIVQTMQLSYMDTYNSGTTFMASISQTQEAGDAYVVKKDAANLTRQAFDSIFQNMDGKCRIMTAPWGPGIEPKTDTDLKDWTFKTSRNCQGFSLDRISNHRTKIELNCEHLPPSILTSKTERPDDIFSVEFGSKCLGDFIDSCCVDENPVPNVVHYVWYTDKELGYFNFLSLMSVIRFMRPCLMIIHGPFVPHGEYWDFIVRLSPNIVHVKRERPTEIFGNTLRFREHSSDVMRLQALIEYGGVYIDFDEVLLRPIDSLRRFEHVQGHELPKTMGSQVVISKKNATFLHLWYNSYRDDYRKIWAYNALWVPNTIANNNPGLIHVEGFNFTRPNWQNVKQIFDKNYDWRTNYGMHMYARWYEKPINLDIMRHLNTTVGSVSRHILLANKEMCKK